MPAPQATKGLSAQPICGLRCSAATRSLVVVPRHMSAFGVQQQALLLRRRSDRLAAATAAANMAAASPPAVKPEAEVPEMTAFLDGLKWDSNGLVVAIAQHADTGEVLMQAFADRAAVNETLQTGYVVLVMQMGWFLTCL